MASTAAEIITLRDSVKGSDARIPEFVELAQLELSASVYGGNYQKALALLVLHWMAKEGTDRAAGAVISEREGDLQRAYAAPRAGTLLDDLDSTSWGQELKRLTKSLTFPSMNRMMG